jgi:hypothetical protein
MLSESSARLLEAEFPVAFVRKSADRERPDRGIVNTQIGAS